ncbi:MAG: hypothetical protein U9Q80_10930 [Bacillota bacterium]|nr:hypothetical protein [Bacillota bacterium]
MEDGYDNLTRENLNKIFKETTFASSVEGSTMDVKKVIFRIDRIRKLLKDGK